MTHVIEDILLDYLLSIYLLWWSICSQIFSLFFFILIFLKSSWLIYLFIYLFLAVFGLRFCARAFSSCGKWGPLFIVVRGPLTVVASRCGAQAPDAQAQ